MQRQIRTPDKYLVRFKRPFCFVGIRRALFLLLALVLPLLAVPTADAAAAVKQVEIMQQKHGYLGALELILAPDAVRISESVNGTVILSKGPEWRVYVYNTRKKLYYDMSLDVWKKHGLRATWVMMANTSEWPVVKVGSEKFLGRETDVYLMPADPNARAKLRMHKPIDFTYGKAGEYWIDKKPADRERTTVILQLYKMPEVPSTPLKLKVYTSGHSRYFGVSNATGGKDQVLLQTLSIKNATVPASTFELPAGYKRAKDDSEVTVSRSNSDSLDSIVKEMGLGERHEQTAKSAEVKTSGNSDTKQKQGGK